MSTVRALSSILLPGACALLAACFGPAHVRSLPGAQLPLTPTPEAPFRAVAPEVKRERLMAVPEVHSSKLENGMSILVVERPDLPFATLIYASDAAHDGASLDTAGLASLVARTLVEAVHTPDGSVDRDPNLDGDTPSIGTNRLGTRIEVTATTDRVPAAIELLARVVRQPALDETALENARGAALRRLSDKSAKFRAIMNRLALLPLYGDRSWITQSPSRRKAAVSKLSAFAVRAFHARRYLPHRSALIVVGQVTAGGVTSLANAAFGSWRSPADVDAGQTIDDAPPAPAPLEQDGPLEIRGVKGLDGQARFTIALPCLGTSDPDDVVFDLIAELLGRGLNSRGMLTLRHAVGDSYYVVARCEERMKSGEFFIDFDVKAERAGDSLEGMLRELDRLRQSPPSDAETVMAKRSLLGYLAAGFVSNAGLARRVATSYLHRRQGDYLATLEDRIQAISPADVQRIAGKYLRRSATGIAVYGDPRILDAQLARFGRVIWMPE